MRQLHLKNHASSTNSVRDLLVWVLRDFRAIRLVTSKCLVDSFPLHIKAEKNIGANFLYISHVI